MPSLPRVGISECLLGHHVRYNGGHKRDPLLLDAFGEHVEWVPVCPEVEVGMGTPREAVRLVHRNGALRMLTIETGIDYTERMHEWSRRRIAQLAAADLDGYVLKSDSPSCGLEGIPLFEEGEGRTGRGLFAAALIEALPLLAVEDDRRLRHAQVRDAFVARVRKSRRVKDG